MIDREPVNIMGVIAFPNPNKDERVIRFIDSEYHTLFTIKDGESIVITHFDGEKMVFHRDGPSSNGGTESGAPKMEALGGGIAGPLFVWGETLQHNCFVREVPS